MATHKSKIVIIGAGMAGLTAANTLFTYPNFQNHFDLTIVEGGTRIGGRINTCEFNGDRIEMGATWIHGIVGSPVYKIAQQINSLNSNQPWECRDGFAGNPVTIAEGGLKLNPSLVHSVYTLYNQLMDFAKTDVSSSSSEVSKSKTSVGSFLQHGFELHLKSCDVHNKDEYFKQNGVSNWSESLIQEAVFGIHENTQRTYTSADDLFRLDYAAESQYLLFPGEEITIAKGYSSIIESLASVLPPGLIQLGKEVSQVEWQCCNANNGDGTNKSVKLHFTDGTVVQADHVIVTVSLGVLKAGIGTDSCLFNPPLPSFKTEAINRVGYGLVNKLFVQTDENNSANFPFLQMAFRRPDSEFKDKRIPCWMRKTASFYPIYKNSNVLLSWFAGKEAFELEKLSNEEILNGVSTTISAFLPATHDDDDDDDQIMINSDEKLANGVEFKFKNVMKSEWGCDPLFLGSYSYVEVGSSVDDLDTLAEPLPTSRSIGSNKGSLQIMFAGEATHRTHYSTTHGAYFSGLREANRLLHHYHNLLVFKS